MRKRVEKYDDMLRKKAAVLLKNAGYETDYKIYCCDTRRGWCSYTRETISIPKWAIEAGKGTNYWVYYLAHELAHAIVNDLYYIENHGPCFMTVFKKVCPSTLWKFELNYKPRNAKAAGIKQ